MNAYRDGDFVIVPLEFKIIDEGLLENGYIPNYIHIRFEDHGSALRTINIYCNAFKSLKGIQLDNKHQYRINLCQAQGFNDWDEINNLHTELEILNPDYAPRDFKGLKTKNTSTRECKLTVMCLSNINMGVLDNINGCRFESVWLSGDVRDAEDKLSGFFKNNIIKAKGSSRVTIYRLAVNNFNFLSSLDPRSEFGVSCQLPAGKNHFTKHSWEKNEDTFKAMFEPFKSPQITEVLIQPKAAPWALSDKTFKTYYAYYKTTGFEVMNKVLVY